MGIVVQSLCEPYPFQPPWSTLLSALHIGQNNLTKLANPPKSSLGKESRRPFHRLFVQRLFHICCVSSLHEPGTMQSVGDVLQSWLIESSTSLCCGTAGAKGSLEISSSNEAVAPCVSDTSSWIHLKKGPSSCKQL